MKLTHVLKVTIPKGVDVGWLASLSIASLLLGFLIAHQVRAMRGGSEPMPIHQRANWLAQRLVEAQEEIKALQKEVDSLRSQLSEYERRASKGKSLLDAMRRNLVKAMLLAGLTPVKGPGIIIELRDSKSTTMPGAYVHDLDLREVVNELRAAGAEAIAINGERLIATSEIRCSEAFIMVNGHRIASPYLIYAVGNPDDMIKALTIPQGIIDRLKVIGLQVKVVPRREVRIPPMRTPPKFKYARPVDLPAEEFLEGVTTW
ncbi:MAG: DUF881 domain-containing protein [Armatimonadota bacterium]|nr:DUF881 domain-containing protein [Armatimonadota bacterium]MCX7777570.1 DUF881 domain-containing protein [Armatimonadota bacterium]MDW8025579.1 DUF881 domain-containing protein [Armatimonadota bacterium]